MSRVDDERKDARATDRVTDVIDQASQTSQLFLDANLKAQLGKSAPEVDHRFDGEHCVEEHCEADLPPARLQLGKVRCVDCQQALEDRGQPLRRKVQP
jgi:RNA polymerase-binding transcription factor DksA